MNLQQLIESNPSVELLKNTAIILNEEQNNLLLQIQEQYGSSLHKASPVLLTDGNYMLGATIILEKDNMKSYGLGFQHLPQELFSQVSIIPIEEAIALLPSQNEEEI